MPHGLFGKYFTRLEYLPINKAKFTKEAKGIHNRTGIMTKNKLRYRSKFVFHT